MNAIDTHIDSLKSAIKNLNIYYKRLMKDASNRTIYPYSKKGISDTLDIIANRAFELKVCNECPHFLNCPYLLGCIDAIDGSADMAKEYGDRCYNALLRRLGD